MVITVQSSSEQTRFRKVQLLNGLIDGWKGSGGDLCSCLEDLGEVERDEPVSSSSKQLAPSEESSSSSSVSSSSLLSLSPPEGVDEAAVRTLRSQIRQAAKALSGWDIEQMLMQASFNICRWGDYDGRVMGTADEGRGKGSGSASGTGSSSSSDGNKAGAHDSAPYNNVFMDLAGGIWKKAESLRVDTVAGDQMNTREAAAAVGTNAFASSTVSAAALTSALENIEDLFKVDSVNSAAISKDSSDFHFLLPVDPRSFSAKYSPVAPGFAGSWAPGAWPNDYDEGSDSDDSNTGSDRSCVGGAGDEVDAGNNHAGGEDCDGGRKETGDGVHEMEVETDDEDGNDEDSKNSSEDGEQEAEHLKALLRTASKLSALLEMHEWKVRHRAESMTRTSPTVPTSSTPTFNSVDMCVKVVTHDGAGVTGETVIASPPLGIAEIVSRTSAADTVRPLAASSALFPPRESDTMTIDTLVWQRREDGAALSQTLADVIGGSSYSHGGSTSYVADHGASGGEHRATSLAELGLGCCLVSCSTAVEDRVNMLLSVLRGVSMPGSSSCVPASVMICRQVDVCAIKGALHDGGVSVIAYEGSSLERSTIRTKIVCDLGSLYRCDIQGKPDPRVLLVSYDIFSTDILFFKSHIWQLVVYDKPWGLTHIPGLVKEFFALPTFSNIITSDYLALPSKVYEEDGRTRAESVALTAPHPYHVARALLPGCLPVEMSVADMLRLAAFLTVTPCHGSTSAWCAWTGADPLAASPVPPPLVSFCFTTDDSNLALDSLASTGVDMDICENVFFPRTAVPAANQVTVLPSDAPSPAAKRSRVVSLRGDRDRNGETASLGAVTLDKIKIPSDFYGRIDDAELQRAKRQVVKKGDRWHVSRVDADTDSERFLGTFATAVEALTAYIKAGCVPRIRVGALAGTTMLASSNLGVNGYSCSSDLGPSAFARLALVGCDQETVGFITSSCTVLCMAPISFQQFARTLGVCNVFGMPCTAHERLAVAVEGARGMVVGVQTCSDTMSSAACGIIEWSKRACAFVIREVKGSGVKVMVNGNLATMRKSGILKNGDVIQCGEVLMVVQLPDRSHQNVQPSHYLMGPSEHRYKLMKNLISNTLGKSKELGNGKDKGLDNTEGKGVDGADQQDTAGPNPVPVTNDLLCGSSRQLKGQSSEHWINNSPYGLEKRKIFGTAAGEGTGGRGRRGQGGSGSRSGGSGSRANTAAQQEAQRTIVGTLPNGDTIVTKSLMSILASRKRARSEYNAAAQARTRALAMAKRRKTRKSSTVFAFGCAGYRSATDGRKEDVGKVMTSWETARYSGRLGDPSNGVMISRNNGVVLAAPWRRVGDGIEERKQYTDIFRGQYMDQVLWGNEGHGELTYNLLTCPYLERNLAGHLTTLNHNQKARVRKPSVPRTDRNKDEEEIRIRREREKQQQLAREGEQARGAKVITTSVPAATATVTITSASATDAVMTKATATATATVPSTKANNAVQKGDQGGEVTTTTTTTSTTTAAAGAETRSSGSETPAEMDLETTGTRRAATSSAPPRLMETCAPVGPPSRPPPAPPVPMP